VAQASRMARQTLACNIRSLEHGGSPRCSSAKALRSAAVIGARSCA
jgi:hypothetical protein